MTYKQIEASREVRLWIGQVFIPAAVVVAGAMSNPEIRHKVSTKFNSVKHSVKAKFQKK